MHSSCLSRGSARRAGRWSGAILGLLVAALSPARAGGPVFVTTKGQPFRWGASRPFRYAVDLGPFGSRTHAAAVALVTRAFQVWQQVSTARFQVQPAGELPRDITAKNVMAFLDGLQED